MQGYIIFGMNAETALVLADDFGIALKAARKVNQNYIGGHALNDNPAWNEKAEITIDENGNILKD